MKIKLSRKTLQDPELPLWPHELVKDMASGASRRGSTWLKRLARCPREHALVKLAKLRVDRVDWNLAIGLVMHYLLEVFYKARMVVSFSEAEDATWEELEKFNYPGYEKAHDLAAKMLGAYLKYAEFNDRRWKVRWVEWTLEYNGEGVSYTSRVDLIVEDPQGTWIVEHKTSKGLTDSVGDGYQMDPQVLGQIWLVRRHPELIQNFRGTYINIITKTSNPRVHRFPVTPSGAHLRAFEDMLHAIHAMEPIYRSLGWPKMLGNCAGPTRFWKRCDYYHLCHGRPGATVDDLMKKEPPLGYKRV